jgi:hypothetical protein
MRIQNTASLIPFSAEIKCLMLITCVSSVSTYHFVKKRTLCGLTFMSWSTTSISPSVSISLVGKREFFSMSPPSQACVRNNRFMKIFNDEYIVCMQCVAESNILEIPLSPPRGRGEHKLMLFGGKDMKKEKTKKRQGRKWRGKENKESEKVNKCKIGKNKGKKAVIGVENHKPKREETLSFFGKVAGRYRFQTKI